MGTVAAFNTLGGAVGLPGLGQLFTTSLAGVQKQDATTVVNTLAPIFQENVKLFQMNPTPAAQAQAIANFENFWLTMASHVQSLGSAGTAAINDRAPGGKFDWWHLYLDPIQNYKFPSGLTAVGKQAVPSVNTDVPPKTPENAATAAAGPSMTQLQAYAGNPATLTQDQWNWYYSKLSGIQQPGSFYTSPRTLQESVGQYYANRAKAGLPTGSSVTVSTAANTPTVGSASGGSTAGASSTSAPGAATGAAGYGGFAALALALGVVIWLKVRA